MLSLSARRADSKVAAFALLAAGATAAVLFGIAYVSLEQPAYAWDWGHYFRTYRSFGSLEQTDPIGAAGALLVSIANWDYNGASIFPLLPVYAVWGDSRPAYVAAILALYTVPACFLAARLAAPRGDKPADWLKALAGTVAALLFWPLWASALRGMPDVVGLIPLGIATMVLLRTGFMTHASPAQALLLGLCLWSAFLLRRWYAFSIVAVGMVAIGFAIVAVIRAPTEKRQALARTMAIAFAICALTIAGCLAAFQAPLVARILHTNYSDIYAAYQAPFGIQLRHLYERAGLILTLAAAAGLLRGVVERDTAVLFQAIASIVTFLLFSRIQEAGIQHVLPIFFWMFPAIVAGATWPATLAQGRAKPIVIAILPVAMSISFAAVFVPGAREALFVADAVLPATMTLPLRLQRFASYEALLADLRGRVASGNRFAVFASSEHLSDSLLTSLDVSLLPAQIPVSNVDQRDGLDLAPFSARYAVATTAPALHLAPSQQRVVALPNDRIVAGLGYGAAYKRVSRPYLLDGGVEATIFERIRPLTAADTSEIVADLQAAYPTWSLQPDGRIR